MIKYINNIICLTLLLSFSLPIPAIEPFTFAKYNPSPYALILNKYVNDDGLVDYKSLKRNRKLLDEYLNSLTKLDPKEFEKWDQPEKIAFWLNAYNAITLQTIINHYPIKSKFIANLRGFPNGIRHISKAWTEKTHSVMGIKYSLDDIEHQILRKEFNEPRIHMALVCAAISCPNLRREPFTGNKLNQQLTEQSFKFSSTLTKFKIDINQKTVYLSKIFDWFGDDFIKSFTPKSDFGSHSKKIKASLNFMAAHLTNDADLDFLKKGDYQVKYLHYNWGLNEQKN